MCNKTLQEALDFLSDLSSLCDCLRKLDVRIAPPATLIREMSKHLLAVPIGAQNMHHSDEGSYTGELSVELIKEAGAQFVILGHPERRLLFGENDLFIQKKVRKAIVMQFPFILCIGENVRGEWKQVKDCLCQQIDSSSVREKGSGVHAVIAYEPAWAIGQKEAVDVSHIVRSHNFIKEYMGDCTPVVYGGSVSLDNISEISAHPSVDGVLIGRASLDSCIFRQMIKELWRIS